MNDLSEKEQLEALRGWWSENGNYVIGGVIIGILTIFGWNRYQSGIAESETAASVLYEEVMTATGDGDMDAANQSAAALFEDYPSSPYADDARLALARLYMDNGRDQDAADTLREVIDNHADKEIALVAKLRLAKIQLYQDKAADVVTLLENAEAGAFSPSFKEVLGDAYVSLGDFDRARASYVSALNEGASTQSVDTSLLQLKINDLPSPEQAAQAAGAAPESAPEPATESAPESAQDAAAAGADTGAAMDQDNGGSMPDAAQEPGDGAAAADGSTAQPEEGGDQ